MPNCLLQMSIIFLDVEGFFVEEAAAIAVKASTLEVVDVYHRFAKSEATDSWARSYIHGLNKSYVTEHGLENEKALADDFRRWMRGRNVLTVFANAPDRERRWLQGRYPVYDLPLGSWVERAERGSHQMALAFKKAWVPLLGMSCCEEAHSNFKRAPSTMPGNQTFEAKRAWGVHCALYDVWELMLAYVEGRAWNPSYESCQHGHRLRL